MFPLNIARGMISIISTPPRKKKQLLEKRANEKRCIYRTPSWQGRFFSPTIHGRNRWEKHSPTHRGRSVPCGSWTSQPLWQLFVREGWGVNPMGRQLHLCYFPKIWDIITKSSRFWEPKLQILHVTGIFTYNWPKKLRIWTMEQSFFLKIWTCLKGVCFSLGGSIMGWTSPTRSRDAFWNTPH